MDLAIELIVNKLKDLDFEIENAFLAKHQDKEVANNRIKYLEDQKKSYLKGLDVLRSKQKQINYKFEFSKARSIVEKKIAKQEQSIQLEKKIIDDKEYILVPSRLFSIFESVIY